MKYAVIVFTFLTVGTMRAVVFGSNTAVSRQALASFPANDATNEMRGFAAFENGFTLASSAASVFFNSFFPIYSAMTFNNGTLRLGRNLTLGSTATFVNGGVIAGNNYSLSMPDKISAFTIGSSVLLGNITLILNSNVTLSSQMTFTGISIIEGRGHTIDLGTTGKMAVDNGGALLMNNLTLKNLSAGQLFCNDGIGTFSLNNVDIILDGNYGFTQGRFDVLGDVEITGGAYTFAYQSNNVSTIKSGATLFFDADMTFSYDVSVSGTLLAMDDTSAVLHFYETNIFSNVPGLTLIKGTVAIDGECIMTSNATSQAQGITFGDGVTSANNINLKLLPESGLTLNSGYLVNKNV